MAEVTGKFNPALTGMLAGIETLREDPKNARKHGSVNLAVISKSLAEYGQQKPVVARKDGTIIAGNGTFRAASQLGWTHLAVTVFDSEGDAKAKGYALADNRSGELATWDAEILKESLVDLELSGVPIRDALGFPNSKEVQQLVKAGGQIVKAQEDAVRREAARAGGGVDRAVEERIGYADMAEDQLRLSEFTKQRETMRARSADAEDYEYWVCLVFQSKTQKKEFLAHFSDLEVLHGQYVDGEEFSRKIGKSIAPSAEKPITIGIDRTLSGMVMP